MKSNNPTGIKSGLTNYGDPEFSVYIRKAFAKAMGYSDEELERPIVGIINTFSGFNSCHHNFGDLIEAVKRGVLSQGGLPIEFPTISLGEMFTAPTTMMFRNLMAMDTEEMIRAQPMDGVVLLGGCDKTVPAQLMGAVSADVPAICLVAGPMIAGDYQGERLGACTDCRRLWGEYRAGRLDREQIDEIEGRLCASTGTCMVMGNSQHYGSIGGGAGYDAAWRRGHSCRDGGATSACGDYGQNDCLNGSTRTSSVEDLDSSVIRKCDVRSYGDWRFNECGHPFDGDCEAIEGST